MAEPLVASPRPAVAGDPDEVLATKLYVPPRQEGFIPRARLVERLNEGLTRALTLVCAPAGFGKTALLADWGREGHAGSRGLSRCRRQRPGALLAPRNRGTGPRPDRPIRSSPVAGPPAPPSFDGLVAHLVNELAASSNQDDVLLVPDDTTSSDPQRSMSH
jgi:LuxR family maltose regulon positive regulatory protein